ncbi:hypothetical protein IE53DRAFT_53469 [Violaceomyces palustris]|uniref:Uncharacterized protein n=1 Tax=Violaceomyces palustris TaxID=1673888 RepID=A0ACD0NZZ3_9BASI|nr:hypothetical protein IE53DRAFT_53469 [Violaceomyces palustris]
MEYMQTFSRGVLGKWLESCAVRWMRVRGEERGKGKKPLCVKNNIGRLKEEAVAEAEADAEARQGLASGFGKVTERENALPNHSSSRPSRAMLKLHSSSTRSNAFILGWNRSLHLAGSRRAPLNSLPQAPQSWRRAARKSTRWGKEGGSHPPTCLPTLQAACPRSHSLSRNRSEPATIPAGGV